MIKSCIALHGIIGIFISKSAAGSVLHDGAAELLAQRMQCPLAKAYGIPMPCPNRSHGAPVFHLHIGKTAGRTVYSIAPDIVGLQNCQWNQANLSWGRPEHFVRTVREHRVELAARPCFTTYEVGWRAVDEGFGPLVPPLVLTTLRDPLSWVVSAIEHDKLEKRRNKGIDDVVRRGCLFDTSIGENRPAGCLGYDYMNFVVSRLISEKAVGRFQDAPKTEYGLVQHRPNYWRQKHYAGAHKNAAANIGRIAIAKVHLDTAIFGLVEHFRATKCLWKFQFGHKITPEECDCRLAPQTNRRRSQSPKPDSERDRCIACVSIVCCT